MLDVHINENTVRDMLEDEIKKQVDKIAKEKYFLTYNELAKYLNLSKPTIEDRLIKNGLRYYKQGTKYLFKQKEVDAFLDDMTASMTSTNNDIKFFEKVMKGCSPESQ